MVSAASQVRSAATALHDIDATTPFTTAAAALPGSQVSQSCVWLSTRLGASLQVWADRLEALAAATNLTAADLDLTDQDVATVMRGATPR